MTEDARAALCRRGLDEIFDARLRDSIAMLIDDVRLRGDRAVSDALARFDQVDVQPDRLRVSQAEIESASISPRLDAAIRDAIEHLRDFNTAVRDRASNWSKEIEPGLQVGEKITPISSAGLFVPSGKASYPSVAYQLAVPAVVAGVPTIALVVPPMPGGTGNVDPAVLAVCRQLGITNVFRVNGPAGIAALGFGTESIPQVRKIVGPGSPAVACAQVEMQRHGVATMMVLGPTESVVVADESADTHRLAADLLVEAEHGEDSTVVLVTTSRDLVERVDLELGAQLADLPDQRARAARAALGRNGGAVVASSLDEAVDIVNRYAPEHLQVVVHDDDMDRVVDGIVNAGEVLIGQDTPFSAANFVIGCPASLPTSGFAHVSSGITAEAFLKRTAIARADAVSLRRMAGSVVALADHEGFPAHGNAIRRRFDTTND